MLSSLPSNFRTVLPRLACILLATMTLVSLMQSASITSEVAQLDSFIPDGLSAEDKELASGLTSTISSMEWLGPLAPIAISPFFGLACLCAISQYGGDFLPFNAFISDNPVLQNPLVLWTFVILTIVTSLPRFSKVSKPVGQAIDQLEAWSGIITIVIIRFAASSTDPGSDTAMMAVPMLQCGVLSVSADVLFSIAAIVNILVINTVKFFFEVSVWLMPFPMVDAILEVANKSVCAALIAVYVWSPFWATVLNGIIFFSCFLAFRWVKRQVTYMRSIFLDPLWAMVFPSHGVPATNELTVFPKRDIGPFKARERLQLIDCGDDWELLQKRLLFPSRSHLLPKSTNSMVLMRGMIVNRIKIDDSQALLFTRRYHNHLPELAKLMDVQIASSRKDSPIVDLAMDG